METARPFIGDAVTIEERGIAFITVDSGYENENYEPLQGWAKWFRDELDQTWVKFDTAGIDEIVHLVYPADQVRCVEYHKPLPISAVE